MTGSPMWTDFSVMDRFETGRLYDDYQDKQHRYRNLDTLTGETHKARFGISVASLGDINLDGFQGSSSTSITQNRGLHDHPPPLHESSKMVFEEQVSVFLAQKALEHLLCRPRSYFEIVRLTILYTALSKLRWVK